MNKRLLKRVLRHIETHPDEWNQAQWRCGTAGCFAGHAAILAGSKWARPRPGTPEPTEVAGDRKRGWKREHVSDRAAMVLGLDDMQAYRLFDAERTLPQIRRIVAGILRGPR